LAGKRLLAVGVIALASVAFGQRMQAQGAGAQLDAFLTDFTARWVRLSPDQATSTRYFTGAEQEALERQLTPQTRGWKLARIAVAREGLARLGRFDRARLTDAQRLSADLMAWQLQIIADSEPFLDYEFPLQQMNGYNINVVEVLTVRHPLATETDAGNYLAALGQVSTRMDEAIDEARNIATKGIIPPTFILNATIRQMRDFSDTVTAQNPFVSVFAEKMASAGIPAVRRDVLRMRAETIVSTQIQPAWKRAIALLESQVPRSSDEAGLSHLKAGELAYSFFLRRYTTTALTPDQIHAIGLAEVARIEKEMDTILRRLGRTEGTVKARVEALKQDLGYPKTEESRDTIMKDVRAILSEAQQRSISLFERTPTSPVVAQPFPRFREANAAANYSAPPPDGSRPGTFQIPLRPERMTKFGLRSLVYHETIPGHHFQIALQVENKGLPRFRQVGAFGGISALSEGWGLYAERLAAESGWYEGDPEGLLGQLDSVLFRARRLVVDTGLHVKHWTRQQGIDYGLEASEVERYAVYPGQACSYMIGQLKIIELREKAQKALGARFSMREFHTVILNTGTVPLEILEQQVDQYIKSKAV
jgi:uncharacterized protein (DUF885 family)